MTSADQIPGSDTRTRYPDQAPDEISRRVAKPAVSAFLPDADLLNSGPQSATGRHKYPGKRSAA